MNETRRDRSRELRAETMEKVAVLADRRLHDTRFDWLRSRERRRAFVAVWFVVVLAVALGALLDQPVLDVVGLIVAGLVTWLLRVVVRAIVDLPDEVLDERQVARRDSAYRLAYSALLSCVSLALVAMYVMADGQRPSYTVLPSHLNALFLATMLLGFGLPSAIFAWTETEI